MVKYINLPAASPGNTKERHRRDENCDPEKGWCCCKKSANTKTHEKKQGPYKSYQLPDEMQEPAGSNQDRVWQEDATMSRMS